MIIDPQQVEVDGITVEVRRKAIKYLRVSVCPPDGRVRVSAPLRVREEAIRHAVIDRLGWIRRHQERLRRQALQSPREMVTGERHYFQGGRFRLQVVEQQGPASVHLENDTMVLHVPPGTGSARRASVLDAWYRRRLQQQLPALLAKWRPIVGAPVAELRVKKMKTRWGSCNIAARRIWLSLELAKKPVACLEYVLVHEMAHLHERCHNARFKRLMDAFMPSWRECREALKSPPPMDEQ